MTANSDATADQHAGAATQAPHPRLKDHWHAGACPQRLVLVASDLLLPGAVAANVPGAELESRAAQRPACWPMPATLLLAVEEQNQVNAWVPTGRCFFGLSDGTAVKQESCRCQPVAVSFGGAGHAKPHAGWCWAGCQPALVLEHNHKVTTQTIKGITPRLAYPFGESRAARPQVGDRSGSHQPERKTLPLPALPAGIALTHRQQRKPDDQGDAGAGTPSTCRSWPGDSPAAARPRTWLYAIGGKASADVFDLRRKQLNGRYKLLATAARSHDQPAAGGHIADDRRPRVHGRGSLVRPPTAGRS
ncbi:hypothetical protein [Stutzerimonas xanthomarina]|uniref:hypothetical protein n=1 Tax=Stutzerimonas xanthomarina TaxID=271420 RepID=UPI003AA93FBE